MTLLKKNKDKKNKNKSDKVRQIISSYVFFPLLSVNNLIPVVLYKLILV